MDAQTLGQLLTAGLMLIAEYKKGRDQVIASGNPIDPATGQIYSDAELIELLRGDGQALVQKIDALLAQHASNTGTGGQ